MVAITCFNTEKVNRLSDRLKHLNVLTLSEAFKAVGHEHRLELLIVLGSEDECCVCDLANTFNSPVPTMSQYLKILKSAKLIDSRMDGKFIYYSLTDLGRQLVALVT